MEQKLIQHAVFKIADFPAEEKPRERLAKYFASSLSNSELLAIILGKGTKKKNVVDLSKEIFASYDLKELSKENIKSLCRIKGIGFAKACQIVACFELGRRTAAYQKQASPAITCAEDVFSLLSPFLKAEKKEHFLGLFLDTRKRIVRQETIFIGTLDTSVI